MIHLEGGFMTLTGIPPDSKRPTASGLSWNYQAPPRAPRLIDGQLAEKKPGRGQLN